MSINLSEKTCPNPICADLIRRAARLSPGPERAVLFAKLARAHRNHGVNPFVREDATW